LVTLFEKSLELKLMIPANCMNKRITVIFILTLFIFSCQLKDVIKHGAAGNPTSFQNTGLQQIIDTLLTNFLKHTPGKYTILIEGQPAAFDTDSLSLFLRNVRSCDIFDENTFDIHEQLCNGIKKITWKAKNSINDTLRLVKYIYQSMYLEDGANNDIKITDFEIFRASGKKSILLRVVNDFEFEQLSIGATDYKLNYYEKIINDTVYRPLIEDRLLGLDEIEKEYETKKAACR
jgi:hypothetical protein